MNTIIHNIISYMCVCVRVYLPSCNVQEKEQCSYCLISKSTIIQFAFEIMNICINNFCIKFIPGFYASI